MLALHPARWFLGLIPLAILGACTVEAPPENNAPGPVGTSGTPGGGGTPPSAGGSGGAPAPNGVAGTTVVPGGTGGTGQAGGTAGGTGGTGAGGEATAGTGGGGPGLPGGKSAGCGKASGDEPNTNVLHNIMAAGEARRYWTTLPAGYDGNTPMPLVFYGPGCGASNVEGSPLDGSIRDKAIRVFVIGTGSCFDTGEAEPETSYFTTVLDDIEANYCTDKGKVFVSGYSSGGWLSMQLACTAGDRITAIGSAAGGFRPWNFPNCKGNPAAIMHAGTGDTANPITRIDQATGMNYGSSAGRDNLLMRNGCSLTETKAWDPMFGFCKEYVGCTSGRVVWCEENTGHSNGGQVSSQGFWKFWSSL
jgi:poly(3-hydroxybutyrate) depolymerase